MKVKVANRDVVRKEVGAKGGQRHGILRKKLMATGAVLFVL